MMLLRCSMFLLAVVAGTFLVPSDAHAYMDPGSGSFVLQMIIAGLVGLGVTLRVYWQKLRRLFGGSSKAEDENDLDD
jgi:hypothetical protein